jgi:glycosyltransferase involved in cell wall biosynthesis
MKVLSVNVCVDPVHGGGTGERTYQMSRFLAQCGVECAVLTSDLGINAGRVEMLRPATVIALRCLNVRYHLFPLPEPRIRNLVRWADVIHLMGHWTLLNALVYREARAIRKPYVVCPAGALPVYGRSRLTKNLYNQLVGRGIVSEASRCVAIAENEYRHFEDYGVESQRVTLIPNGVDPREFKSADVDGFRRKFGLPQGPFVLFLGRMNEIKGPDLLLNAFATAAAARPEMHLVFAGPDGGMSKALRSIVRQHRLENRVRFIGPIRGSDKSDACHAATLLAIPSRQEAMSIVVLEAGICGTPVLITDQCGFDQLESSGGGKVAPATVGGLESAMRYMLADPQRLRAMGQRLRDYVCSEFLWDVIVQKYVRLFNMVLQERTS